MRATSDSAPSLGGLPERLRGSVVQTSAARRG